MSQVKPEWPNQPLNDPIKLLERQQLLDILSSDNKTFEQCLQQFNNKFNRNQWFSICCTICYLLEGNLLTKSQRIVAFYILYKVYNNENFKVTPFESIVLSSINQCLHVVQNQPDSQEALDRKAEHTLLNDFVVSIPMVSLHFKKLIDFWYRLVRRRSASTSRELSRSSLQSLPMVLHPTRRKRPTSCRPFHQWTSRSTSRTTLSRCPS